MVVLIIVFLLSVSEVISQCPPSSGKTLDVYSNNCFVFIGIYLMHNGDCYPNGSYFLISLLIIQIHLSVLCQMLLLLMGN